jgi:hypothetical protein
VLAKPNLALGPSFGGLGRCDTGENWVMGIFERLEKVTF